MPEGLGTFLALTGFRLKGNDCVYAGIATHFVPTDALSNLEKDLLNCENPDTVPSILSHYCQHVTSGKEFSLKANMDKIHKHFGIYVTNFFFF